MKKEKTNYLLLIVCFLVISVVIVSCSVSDNEAEAPSNQKIESSKGVNNSFDNMSEEEFNQLLESEGFLEVFNSFYYPDSEIKEVRQAEDSESDENLLYILLETEETSGEVEEYYKEKKVQSVWSRAVIFEESAKSVEEEFLEEESESIPIYKFTYHSSDKDKIVNVLVKGLEENRTRIMIIYWELK